MLLGTFDQRVSLLKKAANKHGPSQFNQIVLITVIKSLKTNAALWGSAWCDPLLNQRYFV